MKISWFFGPKILLKKATWEDFSHFGILEHLKKFKKIQNQSTPKERENWAKSFTRSLDVDWFWTFPNFFKNVLEYRNGSKLVRGSNLTYSLILLNIKGAKKSGFFQDPTFVLVKENIFKLNFSCHFSVLDNPRDQNLVYGNNILFLLDLFNFTLIDVVWASGRQYLSNSEYSKFRIFVRCCDFTKA